MLLRLFELNTILSNAGVIIVVSMTTINVGIYISSEII